MEESRQVPADMESPNPLAYLSFKSDRTAAFRKLCSIDSIHPERPPSRLRAHQRWGNGNREGFATAVGLFVYRSPLTDFNETLSLLLGNSFPPVVLFTSSKDLRVLLLLYDFRFVGVVAWKHIFLLRDTAAVS